LSCEKNNNFVVTFFIGGFQCYWKTKLGIYTHAYKFILEKYLNKTNKTEELKYQSIDSTSKKSPKRFFSEAAKKIAEAIFAALSLKILMEVKKLLIIIFIKDEKENHLKELKLHQS
jgi:hypothetical protein